MYSVYYCMLTICNTLLYLSLSFFIITPDPAQKGIAVHYVPS